MGLGLAPRLSVASSNNFDINVTFKINPSNPCGEDAFFSPVSLASNSCNLSIHGDDKNRPNGIFLVGCENSTTNLHFKINSLDGHKWADGGGRIRPAKFFYGQADPVGSGMDIQPSSGSDTHKVSYGFSVPGGSSKSYFVLTAFGVAGSSICIDPVFSNRPSSVGIFGILGPALVLLTCIGVSVYPLRLHLTLPRGPNSTPLQTSG